MTRSRKSPFVFGLVAIASLSASTWAATIRGLEERSGPFSFSPGDSVTRISPDGTVVVNHRNCPPNADCAYATWPVFTKWQSTEPGAAGAEMMTDLAEDGSRYVGVSYGNSTESGFSGYLADQTQRVGRFEQRFAIDGLSPLSISGDGQTVAGTTGYTPFFWTEENGITNVPLPIDWEFATVNDISLDGTNVVGMFRTGDDVRAYRMANDGGFDNLHSIENGRSAAMFASSDGSTVTGTFVENKTTSLFRWSDETDMQVLTTGSPAGISGDGSIIVGNSEKMGDVLSPFPSFGWREPFIWTEEHGVRDLRTVLVEDYGMGHLLEGWDLHSVVDISADGMTLVGRGDGPNNQNSWLVTLAETEPCDLNADGICDVADIQLLTFSVINQKYITAYDTDLDLNVDENDRRIWVNDLMQTTFGDSNLDGLFDSKDLIQVMSAAEYEDDSTFNSTWAEGDSNGDGDFDSEDLILAFRSGHYSRDAAIAAHAVPEPNRTGLSAAVLLTVCFCNSHRVTKRGHLR